MKNIFRIPFFILVLSASSICQVKNEYVPYDKLEFHLSSADDAFLDSIQYYSFLYFLNETNPDNGLIPDRNADWSPSSIAAVGFGLPSFAIASERGWISREQAAAQTLNTLIFFFNAEQSDDDSATGYNGFFYHFIDMKSGKRSWNCELSTIDTGWLIAGIIFCRQFYDQQNETENQIRELADKILNRLDWEFFIMPKESEDANSISMGWTPENGLHFMGWRGYNEAIMLYIIAAGLDMENIESAFQAWLSSYEWQTPYENLSSLVFPPLFGHQYSHMFVDFRYINDPYMKEKGIDYFENSRRAVYIQRQYAIDNPYGWVGYDSLCWGISACDGPGEKFNFDGKEFLGYAGRGTSGPDLVYSDDGTIAPTAIASSIVFAPELVIPTLKSLLQKYGDRVWGKYGFVDAFNLTADWFDPEYLGLDQGPIILMIENFKTGLIWNYVMKDSIIQKGLKKLGFEKLK